MLQYFTDNQTKTALFSMDACFTVTVQGNLQSDIKVMSPDKTRGRGGLTQHLYSEAPAGNRKIAMTDCLATAHTSLLYHA